MFLATELNYSQCLQLLILFAAASCFAYSDENVAIIHPHGCLFMLYLMLSTEVIEGTRYECLNYNFDKDNKFNFKKVINVHYTDTYICTYADTYVTVQIASGTCNKQVGLFSCLQEK